MKPRVLLVHNYYDSSKPSGEAQVVAVERDLLRRHGHTVSEYYRHSDEIIGQGRLGLIRGALSTPWNPFAARAVRAAARKSAADIVHVHNTFPLLSPAIFHAVGPCAARVLTLHNYRLFCAAAFLLRDGNVCTRCLDTKSAVPALRYGCYRNRRVTTVPLAFSVALHRFLHTWRRHVDAFIVLTQFQRDLMVGAGLPAERVHVKPNFFPGQPEVIPWEQRAEQVVYIGRLTAEKAVETLVRAWLAWGPSAPRLLIVGDGELRASLVELAATAPGVPIEFLGKVSRAEAHGEIARSRLLVLPSRCIEGFPLTLAEAFAYGTPAAVADIGPLPALVQDYSAGNVFSPGDPQAILDTIRSLWETQGTLEQMGRQARRAFEDDFSEQTNYATLMDIYQAAIDTHRRRYGRHG
jgi:glycosyltransferase involved in cell wall biosynthesis